MDYFAAFKAYSYTNNKNVYRNLQKFRYLRISLMFCLATAISVNLHILSIKRAFNKTMYYSLIRNEVFPLNVLSLRKHH